MTFYVLGIFIIFHNYVGPAFGQHLYIPIQYIYTHIYTLIRIYTYIIIIETKKEWEIHIYVLRIPYVL